MKSDADAFTHILAALHEAMLDDTQWPATSALIDAACGVTGNGLLVGTGPKDDVRAHFVGLYYRGERRVDLERDYLTLYHPIDERVPRLRQLPDSRLVHVTTLYTAQELKTSVTYNEALALGHAQDSLNVRLAGPPGSHITWGINDPVTPGGWTAPQLALIKGLLPHLRQFLRVRQALSQAAAVETTVLGLLDKTRIGVLHLDRRGRIVAANDRAQALLRQGDGLADRAGELVAGVPAEHPRLARLVAGALPTSSAPAVSGSLLLRRAATRPRLVVHVLPVGDQQWAFGAHGVAALVLVVEPGYAPRLDPAVVAEVLGLTATESQIAVRLAAGQTVREIAGATGRPASAVYWHLKQSYQKLGIARQADLVRVVLSVPAVG